MKKILFLSIALALLFLPGCITIFEKYSLNRDGSGTMEYLIDMSQLYAIIGSMADSTEEDVEVDQSFEDVMPALREIEGITNVHLSGDRDHYIYGIKYDFRDTDALNAALGLLMEKENHGDHKFVDISRRKFVRYKETANEISMDSILGDSGEMDENMMSGILDEMKYNITVSFPRKIRKIETGSRYIQEDPKTVVIETNFSDLINNPEILKTTIKTK